jgi:hypothetical protein
MQEQFHASHDSLNRIADTLDRVEARLSERVDDVEIRVRAVEAQSNRSIGAMKFLAFLGGLVTAAFTGIQIWHK